MITAAIVFLCLAGLFLIIQRERMTLLQKIAFGARLHVGCAVAEGIALLLLAGAIALLYSRGHLP